MAPAARGHWMLLLALCSVVMPSTAQWIVCDGVNSIAGAESPILLRLTMQLAKKLNQCSVLALHARCTAHTHSHTQPMMHRAVHHTDAASLDRSLLHVHPLTACNPPTATARMLQDSRTTRTLTHTLSQWHYAHFSNLNVAWPYAPFMLF